MRERERERDRQTDRRREEEIGGERKCNFFNNNQNDDSS